MKIRNWSYGRGRFVDVDRSGVTPSYVDGSYFYTFNVYDNTETFDERKYMQFKLNEEEAQKLFEDFGKALKWRTT